jgi:hypothetical protein
MSDAEYKSQTPIDNDYASRTGQNQIPVQKDEAPIEDPIDPDTADSDQVLEADEKAAMNEDNIIESRLRDGAEKPKGTYQEPGDEEVSFFC